MTPSTSETGLENPVPLICEPKGGWRHVEVTEQPHCRGLSTAPRCGGWWTRPDPDAEVVRLVLDNLNTQVWRTGFALRSI